MTRQSAERAVVVSALVVAAVYAYRRVMEETGTTTAQDRSTSKLITALGYGPPPPFGRFVTGWGFTYMVLGVTAQFAPDLAGSLAIIVAVSDSLANGGALAQDIQVSLGNRGGTPTAQELGAVNGVPVLRKGETGAQFDQRLNDYLTGRVKAGTIGQPTTVEPVGTPNPLLANPLTGTQNPLIK